MIIFIATDEQAKQIAVNAIHASVPVGMGMLHFVPGDHFKTSDIRIDEEGAISLDYVQGRMVKLYMKRCGDGTWGINNHGKEEVNVEYESWATTYPTYEDLIGSVIK